MITGNSLEDDRRFSECLAEAYRRVKAEGLLVTAIGSDGRPNVMTIGWLLFGWFYEKHPMAVIAVRPATHTFNLLDQVPEFVLGIPRDGMQAICRQCGTESGRETDKFAACPLTARPSRLVRPPSIAECSLNMECRVYHAQRPPHMLLTPRHRQAPLHEQHTLYYAEILGAFG